ncbi:T7SS effector LXG polymorphic toxin [Rummeliibacillus sp. POC4]|uniref:T7SS effector LXG polymorphic toxin n=1 Tax=Rummeliibacillus sp. POC4 TaxID=2305899 RepID=UPI000E65F716|nr:T7SS effector LXG polymorphic toxin [Rummeliibacillus sp. POC4]RIJ63201.1 hypothetical protein D1606_16245 [Rummeliibacillus sp. POC4]
MKIAMEELLELQLDLHNSVKSITAKLDTLKQKTDNISKIHSFQGETADTTKQYFKNVHGQTIIDLEETARLVLKNYSEVIKTFQQIVDADSAAILTKEYLLDLDKEVKTIETGMLDTHHEGEQILTSVSDIISLQVPPISHFIDNVDNSEKHIEEVKERFHRFDQRGLQIVKDSKQDVEKVMQKIIQLTANSIASSNHFPNVNSKDIGKVQKPDDIKFATMAVGLLAGMKSFDKVLKNINKANTMMTATAQLYTYYKLDEASRRILKNSGIHALTKEQYRNLNNILSKTTLYKFKVKEFMKHLGEFKTKAFTEENYKALKNSLDVYGKERGKLALMQEYDKLFGLEKYRETLKLSPSKRVLKMATTFGDEFVGKTYKSTKKTIKSLPSWKNPKIAYKNAAESFKESTKGMNSLGKSMMVAGKSLGPLGVGIVAADNYKTYKGNTQKVVVGTVVDTTYGAGATAMGATVGSFLLPPIGTVLGAGVGIGSTYLANLKWGKPPKSTTERTKDLANSGIDRISKTTKKMGESLTKWFN